MENDTISVLAAVAVFIILIRTLIDMIMFLFNSESMIVGLGWPVNKFWMNSIFWVVLNMFVLTLIVIWYKPGLWYSINLAIVPFGWAYVLLRYTAKTKWMIYDAISWIVVGIAGFVVYAFW